MIENTIKKLNENTDLTYDETKITFNLILNGEASTKQINDFISALGNKKETASEIAGSIDGISSHMSKKITINANHRKDYSNSLNF